MNEPKTFIEPLAGYLLDVFAKLRNRIVVPHSLTKLHNLKTCRDLTGASTVVEIGTFKGVTTKRLSRLFTQVITVEIDESLHVQAKKRCASRTNIELILGDGSKVLSDIASRVKNTVLFLDGHYSGGVTGQGDEPEPVLKELDSVVPYLDNFNAIVIDDFRLFGVEEGWPKKHEVMEKLETIFDVRIWNIAILNDQFLIYRIKH